MDGTICHADMDAFFASVEIRAAPHLKDVPLVVGGGPGPRGVVTTASYPARVFGIRSGMSMCEARSRCPDLVFLPVDPAKYLDASRRLLSLFESFTPAVEPASIDEVFLDLTAFHLDPPRALEIGRRIKKEVRDRENLTCSIGLGPNKLQAKMATGLEKPDGLVQLLPGDFERRFGAQPVQKLWGVGPETSKSLETVGIRTIGELARASDQVLESMFGITGKVLIRMARGFGGGAVVSYHEGAPARSMGHETTFPADISDLSLLERYLLLLCDKVARRMRREEFVGHVVCVRIRRSDRTTVSRQRALALPTDQEKVILAHARRLLRENLGSAPVRMLGVSVGHLISNRNLYPLLEEDRKAMKMAALKDRLRDRFGETVLMPAGVLRFFDDEQ